MPEVKTICGSICAKHPELLGKRRMVYGLYPSNCLECEREYKKTHYDRRNELRNAKRRSMTTQQRSEMYKEFNRRYKHLKIAGAKRRKKGIERQSSIAKTYSKEISEIYRLRPEGHDVDHIVPLHADGVCGLHVPWNLQYLPSEVNRQKSNRMTFS